MFKNKVLMITGGTGSFGNAVLKHFLNSDLKEIRIFSRDEKKQEDMRIEYKNDRLNFIIGNVRDFDSINNAMLGVDYVFHAAALKQVPSCEFYPMQAIRTNLYGAENVLEAAARNNVKKVVVLSTDKAAYPINAMGMTKALMEKLAVSKARDSRVMQNGGVFRAGIIRGDDYLVREPRSDAPHFGALRPVAVAAAAEHDEHARVGKAADGRENIFQPVGRVCIINEHGVVRVRRHHLRPAAHALTE